MKIKITRFVDEPIIPPFLDQEIGSNINGPSLIRAPNWIAGLGKYYLYFADHKGDNIKNIFLLTADAFGVLPPISKLDKGQAMYHFISGYTAKIPGTEEDISEPVVTFSACFGPKTC